MSRQAPPQRILIIRPSALGDVCRTVPVLASLRAAYPGAIIDWVVQDDFAPAIESHPALSRVVTFPRARFARWWRNPRAAWEVVTWFRQLRRQRYDLVLDCQGLGRSGLMAAATGAPQRVGLRHARELAWLGYNIRAPFAGHHPPPTHTVDQMLLLVKSIGIEPIADMRLYTALDDVKWWARRREAFGFPAGRYAVIAPTSRWLSKRWPIDRFAQLIEPLHQRGFERVVIVGSPSEVRQVHELVDRFPPASLSDEAGEASRRFVIDLVGKSTIGQTMAVIAHADLVIANDSAPLHMAVGFGRPCVALFGPTDPAEVGPYRRDESIVRGFQPPPNQQAINFKDSKLGDSLMRFISTAAVIQRIDYVLSMHARRGIDNSSSPPLEDRQSPDDTNVTSVTSANGQAAKPPRQSTGSAPDSRRVVPEAAT
jgi:heptosyltransferase-1